MQLLYVINFNIFCMTKTESKIWLKKVFFFHWLHFSSLYIFFLTATAFLIFPKETAFCLWERKSFALIIDPVFYSDFYLPQRDRRVGLKCDKLQICKFHSVAFVSVSIWKWIRPCSQSAHTRGSRDPRARIKAPHSFSSPVFSHKRFRYNMFPWCTSWAWDAELVASLLNASAAFCSRGWTWEGFSP